MKKPKIALFLIVIVSILYRFYFQFLAPVFNIDEISLGTNIKNLSFLELLHPFPNFQSAPPLYLWLQKLTITVLPFKFWINIKVISFLVSTASVLFFYRFLKNTSFWIALLMLVIFCFNPYIVYNSLTLKQYGFDLLGIVILLNYYEDENFIKKGWLFFIFWCLLSNVGLFGCAGYLIFRYFNLYGKLSMVSILNYLKSHYLFVIAPLPYIIYFFWFMQQEYAIETKQFMSVYWRDSFIPLDSSIFKYSLRLVHELWICFFNAYEVLGIVLMTISLSTIGIFNKKRTHFYINSIVLLFLIGTVHVFLNILKMYPLSDRLFLYLSPLFILCLGAGVKFWTGFLSNKISRVIIVGAILTISLTYYTYSDYKNNDVPALNKYLLSFSDQEIVATNRAIEYIDKFNRFTDHEFQLKKELVPIGASSRLNFDILISKVHKKLKPNAYSTENDIVETLLKDHRVDLIKQVAGYNIYRRTE